LLLIFFPAADFFDDSCENKEISGKILELKMFNLSTGTAPQRALNAYKSHSLSTRIQDVFALFVPSCVRGLDLHIVTR
jgi:hypothetical protein